MGCSLRGFWLKVNYATSTPPASASDDHHGRRTRFFHAFLYVRADDKAYAIAKMEPVTVAPSLPKTPV